MRKQKGFTMLELIIVIVITGILGALLVPRIAAFDNQARLSAITSLQGALWSAVSITHQQAILSNQTGATGIIALEGQTINLVYGYPTRAAGGIDVAVNTLNGFGYTAATGIFDFSPTPRANCAVNYAEPTAINTAPTITATTVGC